MGNPIKLTNNRKKILKAFLDYRYRRKNTKLSFGAIRKETKLQDAVLGRELKVFRKLEYIKKVKREYSINPKKLEEVKGFLEYHQKEDDKLYDFIPLLSSLIIIILIISLVGVIFYYTNYVYEIEASPNITSIIPKTSPFKTATITTNLTCGEINESLGYNMICRRNECRCVDDINISDDWNSSK